MNKKSLRALIDTARAAGRAALTAPEAQQLCDAYGIPTPKQGLAKTAAEAVKLAAQAALSRRSENRLRTIFCIKPKRAG